MIHISGQRPLIADSRTSFPSRVRWPKPLPISCERNLLARKNKSLRPDRQTILRLTMPTCVVWLYTENGKLTRQYPCGTEVSQRSGALGRQARPQLGAAVIRRCDRLSNTHSSTNGR